MKLIETIGMWTIVLAMTLYISTIKRENDEYKQQIAVKDSLANEVYMSYKYFVHLHSDYIINRERTTEQMESFDLLDAKIDKLIFSKEP